MLRSLCNYYLQRESALIWGVFFIVFHAFPVALFAQNRAVPVVTATVQSDNVSEQLPLTGTVVSKKTSMLSTKVAGYVSKLFVEAGDVVEEGDVLLELDKQLAVIELQRIQALLNEAVARDNELKRRRNEANDLLKKQHISETTFKAAEAEVNINSSVLQRLQVELKRQKVVVEQHFIKAPFAGVITQRVIEVGQWIDTGSALFNITVLNPLRIEVPVPQFYFNKIHKGTGVTVSYDSLPNKQLKTKVSIKVPLNQQATRTFPVMIDIENERRELAPGMSAKIVFHLDDSNNKQRLLIPIDAVIRKIDGTEQVWKVIREKQSTKVKPIKVTLGKSFGHKVELLDGDIVVGDELVIKGNELLTAMQSVDVIEKL